MVVNGDKSGNEFRVMGLRAKRFPRITLSAGPFSPLAANSNQDCVLVRKSESCLTSCDLCIRDSGENNIVIVIRFDKAIQAGEIGSSSWD